MKMLGVVFDENRANIPRIHKGLRAARHTSITLADHQEVRLQHFHRRLAQQLELDS